MVFSKDDAGCGFGVAPEDKAAVWTHQSLFLINAFALERRGTRGAEFVLARGMIYHGSYYTSTKYFTGVASRSVLRIDEEQLVMDRAKGNN